MRYAENLAVARAWRDMDVFSLKKEASMLMGLLLLVKESELSLTNKTKVLLEDVNWYSPFLDPPEVVNMIRLRLLPVLPAGTAVGVYSRTTVDEITYTANPRHGGKKTCKHEWAYFNIGNESIACQLLCLLVIPKKPSRRVHINGSVVDEAGRYAYVHCVNEELKDSGDTPYGPSENQEGSLAHADQKLVHRMPKSHRNAEGKWVPATADKPPTPLLLPLQSLEI